MRCASKLYLLQQGSSHLQNIALEYCFGILLQNIALEYSFGILLQNLALEYFYRILLWNTPTEHSFGIFLQNFATEYCFGILQNKLLLLIHATECTMRNPLFGECGFRILLHNMSDEHFYKLLIQNTPTKYCY